MQFTVLMSVYAKESVKNLVAALDSIIVYQTVKPNQVLIVEDGPLPQILDKTIQSYAKKYQDIIEVIKLERNSGLGIALNEGLKFCRNELVARMDSDDICVKDRFEQQLSFFEKNNDVDVCGGNIEEFYDRPEHVKTLKKMPISHNAIVNGMKIRNPMNHMTVMFKKKAVMDSGGYKPLFYLEDYYLWIRLAANGCILANLDKVLVKVRTGEGMFQRRGNKAQIKGWFFLQKELRKVGIITVWELIRNMIGIICFTSIPSRLRKKIYEYFLRDKIYG